MTIVTKHVLIKIKTKNLLDIIYLKWVYEVKRKIVKIVSYIANNNMIIEFCSKREDITYHDINDINLLFFGVKLIHFFGFSCFCLGIRYYYNLNTFLNYI